MTDGFGRSYTLGVEEELFLVDAQTHALAPGASELVAGRTPRLKTELFECMIETTTGICETPEAALEELRERREEVRALAAERGLAVLASGTHPFSSGPQPVVQERRYAKMLDELGEATYRQTVCGLHVHVGMPSAEACIHALEGVLRALPGVLALSANSPWAEGAETGLRSSRAPRLLELPSGGVPPPLHSFADWEVVVSASGRDYTRLWWDVRPHPRLGTLEVRIADQQTDVRRSAAIAALVRELARAAAESPGGSEPLSRPEYLRLRAEAAAGTLAPLETPLVPGLPEAERQLEAGRSGGARAVAADLVERSR